MEVFPIIFAARDIIALQNERLKVECKANMPITIRVDGGLVIQSFLHDGNIKIENVKTRNGGVSQVLNTNLKEGDKVPLTMILENGFSQDLLLLIKEKGDSSPLVFCGESDFNKTKSMERDDMLIAVQKHIATNHLLKEDGKEIKKGVFKEHNFEVMLVREELFLDKNDLLDFFSMKKCKSIFWIEPKNHVFGKNNKEKWV